MLKLVLHLNKLHQITIISLLVCSLLLSFYCINYSVEVYKKVSEGHLINKDVYNRNSTSNKINYANDRVTDSYKEEVTFQKAPADNYQSLKKWNSFFVVLLFIFLMSVITLYVKEWFIKVRHWTYQFIKVHFTQLKDGKKDALSYLFSM